MTFDPFFDTDPDGATQSDIEQRRALAQSLLGQSQQPANYWTQGLSNVVNSFLGGLEMGRSHKEEAQNDEWNKAQMANIAASIVPNVQTSATQTASPPAASPVAEALIAPSAGAEQNGAAAAKDLITQSFLDHMKQAESGGDLYAKATSSSATGPFQFTNPTWTGMMHNHPELGLTADGRTDPAQSEAAAKQLASDNLASLLANGVSNPTQGGLYLAHFAGPSAAARALTADPSTPASAVLSPQQIAANPFTRNMTTGDLSNWASQKMGQTVAPVAQPQQGSPQMGAYAVPPVAQTQQMPQLGALASLMSDPRANSQSKQVAGAMLSNVLQSNLLGEQERIRQSDPLYQAEINERNAQIQTYQQKLNAPQNSQLPTEVAALDARARMAGLQPGTQQYQQFMLTGGKQLAQSDGTPSVLTPQQAQQSNLDPSKTWAVGHDGVPKAVGDSPQTVQQKAQATAVGAQNATQSVTDAANSAIALLDQHPYATTGTMGHYAAEWLPGSNAGQLRNYVETMKANGSYATMMQLKSQGVSLGQMSDADMRLAAAKAGAINPDAPPAVLRKQIEDYSSFVKRAYAGKGPDAASASSETSAALPATKAPSVSNW
ncbi:MAG: hypothetical protein ABF968_04780 [Acetobacter sp.]|uniref:hypothetical protein n=1 Tax=Acetobacter sp. TaxID=440 RepID=UPI0039EC91DD